MLPIETVQRLRSCLARLEQVTDGPRLDIEWLRARCDDTLRSTGSRQVDSLRQLKADVASFAKEFPGVIPAILVDAMSRSPTEQ